MSDLPRLVLSRTPMLSTLLIALVVPAAMSSAQPVPTPTPVVLRVKDIDPKSVIHPGGTLTLTLERAPTDGALRAGKYWLYLNDLDLKLAGDSHDPEGRQLQFVLKREEANRESWNRLLGGSVAATRPLTLLVKTETGTPVVFDASVKPALTFQVIAPGALGVAGIAFLAALGAFVMLAIKSDVIRDTGPPQPPANARRPYSLARLQMAVWFFVVLAAFGFIYLLTRDTRTLGGQELALMGIASGTALSAAAIDANKRSATATRNDAIALELKTLEVSVATAEAKKNLLPAPAAGEPIAVTAQRAAIDEAIGTATARRELLEREQQELAKSDREPVSAGLLTDILTDVNGISFHRFQMLIWTIVLVVVFLSGVFHNLAMPPLDEKLLALMGISAGTYLGFKFPEKQG